MSLSKDKKTRLIQRGLKALIFIGVINLAVFLVYSFGWRLNTTPSYPRGIYKFSSNIENIQNGEMIAFCPPNEGIFKLALEREYIRQGNCKGGLPPFVKKAVGFEGDKITVTDHIQINNVSQFNSQVVDKDSKGRPLQKTKNQIVAAEHYFVMSEYNPASLDSRYFGPIPQSWIIARAKPIWTSPKL